MSGTVVIVLIVVVWLFVLAPWLLRGQRPISKAGEAFDETRVVYSGGSELAAPRKRPKLMAQDVHATREVDASAETVTAEPLVEDEASQRIDHAVDAVKAKLKKQPKAEETEKTDHVEPTVVEGEVVMELPEESHDEATVVDLDDFHEEPTFYEVDDSFTTAADLMHPEAEDDQPIESAVDVEEPETDEDPVTLTEEELEFAAHRAQRGGWDPHADEQLKLSRYQRRTRTLIGLGAAAVLALIVGFIVGGWAWLLPAVVFAFAGVYLVALRGQVQAEERLRARRIAQLRRARLGVRNENDAALGIPQRLRRPGAVVLELDDESPDFVELDTVSAPQLDEPVQYTSGRRVS